jgi:hypothetical protein
LGLPAEAVWPCVVLRFGTKWGSFPSSRAGCWSIYDRPTYAPEPTGANAETRTEDAATFKDSIGTTPPKLIRMPSQ